MLLSSIAYTLFPLKKFLLFAIWLGKKLNMRVGKPGFCSKAMNAKLLRMIK